MSDRSDQRALLYIFKFADFTYLPESRKILQIISTTR